MAQPVDDRQGVRLIEVRVIGHPRVALGAADDKQERKVDALSAGQSTPLRDGASVCSG
jgi:hypothetical protein